MRIKNKKTLSALLLPTLIFVGALPVLVFAAPDGNPPDGLPGAKLNTLDVGGKNVIEGKGSAAVGDSNKVSGFNSSAVGDSNKVTRDDSFAIGFKNVVASEKSVAIGEFNATGYHENSLIVGSENAVYGTGSFVVGNNDFVYAPGVFINGYKNMNHGYWSFASGSNLRAKSYNSAVFGRYNVINDSYDSTKWIDKDPLFVIGNGKDEGNRSNAVTVLKNGNVGIGTANPSVALDVVGSVSIGPKDVYKNTITGLSSFVVGNLNKVTGDTSFASGYGNEANGDGSFATGGTNKVDGSDSFASGGGNTVEGINSFAAGNTNLVTPSYSQAFGQNLKVQSYNSAAFGRYNVATGSPTKDESTDPLFVIGNGSSDTDRKNAVTVLKNGNVGIGTANPKVALDLIGSVSIGMLEEGYENKVTPWISSLAIGVKNVVSAPKSLAIGNGNKISGLMGEVLAVGYNNSIHTESYGGGLANGFGNKISAGASLATGLGNEVFAAYSLAAGRNNTVSSSFSLANGSGNKVVNSGLYSLVTGEDNTVLGSASFVSGSNLKAQSYNSASFGRYNVDNGNLSNWVETDPLFVIGNGSSNTNRKNAVTVLKNGKVGIGVTHPNYQFDVAGEANLNKGIPSGIALRVNGKEALWYDGTYFSWGYDGNWNFFDDRVQIGTKGNYGSYKLAVNGNAAKSGGGSWSNLSDIRLKDVHGNYEKGLKEILQLNPVKFNYKKDNPKDLPSDEEQFGFVAQDVQPVFPEAVSEGKDGYLDFNFHPIHVAVVNAIKELKTEKDEQIAKLQSDLDELKALICEVKPEAKQCQK